jgi:hypothetical protein
MFARRRAEWRSAFRVRHRFESLVLMAEPGGGTGPFDRSRPVPGAGLPGQRRSAGRKLRPQPEFAPLQVELQVTAEIHKCWGQLDWYQGWVESNPRSSGIASVLRRTPRVRDSRRYRNHDLLFDRLPSNRYLAAMRTNHIDRQQVLQLSVSIGRPKRTQYLTGRTVMPKLIAFSVWRRSFQSTRPAFSASFHLGNIII